MMWLGIAIAVFLLLFPLVVTLRDIFITRENNPIKLLDLPRGLEVNDYRWVKKNIDLSHDKS